MPNPIKLTQAFDKLLGRFEVADPVYRARYIEQVSDNVHTVDILTADGLTGPRVNVYGRVLPYPGALVRVSIDRKRWGPDRWVIVNQDETSYDGDTPIVMLPLHGHTHNFEGADESAGWNTWQINPLRAQPQDPEDQTVLVGAGLYQIDGSFYELTANTTVDLSAEIAALVGAQRQYIVLSIDTTGTINKTEGTVVGVALTASDIPTLPDGEFYIAAIDIRAGDTTIERERTYNDIRFIANPGTGAGVFLNHIILYSGATMTGYDLDDTGMAAAIAAAVIGDTIYIPPVQLDDDYVIPAGVSVVGVSTDDVIFTGQIRLRNGSVLETLTVDRDLNDAFNYQGVLGPDTGTAYIRNCIIDVNQAGGGDGYGVSCYGRNGDIHVYQGYVFGSTSDARTN